MSKVRLVGAAWSTYSSFIGTTKFENGVSEGDVSPAELRILGAVTAIEVLDEDGEYRPAGPGDLAIAMRSMPAPHIPDLKPVDPSELPEKKAEKPEVIKSDVASADPDVTPEPDEVDKAAKELDESVEPDEDATDAKPATIYTLEDLEAVADKDGIAGLRAIGDTRGVKSNSIEGIIKKILEAQKAGE